MENKKIFLITGATNGIGFYTAETIAKTNNILILSGKNKKKGENILHRIKKSSKNEDIFYINGDLSSQNDILNIHKIISNKFSRIDVLINNAGAAYLKKENSLDGIEKTLATNHLSFFLLTGLMLPMLLKSKNSRIINVSSAIHHKCENIDFNDIQMKKSYDVFKAYRQSKLFNILFTYFLSQKLQSSNISVNCLDPGNVNTGFSYIDNRDLLSIYLSKIANFSKKIYKKKTKSESFLNKKTNQISPYAGSQTSVYLATDKEVQNITGKYFQFKKIVKSSKISYDLSLQSKLWTISEKLTNFTY